MNHSPAPAPMTSAAAAIAMIRALPVNRGILNGALPAFTPGASSPSATPSVTCPISAVANFASSGASPWRQGRDGGSRVLTGA